MKFANDLFTKFRNSNIEFFLRNVLGKRLKKPNAIAEFKNAQKRKPRKANPVVTDVAPVPESSSESSESEADFEGSDLSN